MEYNSYNTGSSASRYNNEKNYSSTTDKICGSYPTSTQNSAMPNSYKRYGATKY